MKRKITETGHNEPIPVPKAMHTRRGSVRALAALAVVLSLVIYCSGTKRLQEQFSKNSAGFYDGLQLGSQTWTLNSKGSAEHCLGHMTITMDNLQHPQLDLKGNVVVPVFGSPLSMSFDAAAYFSSYYQLEDFVFKVTAGSTKIVAETTGEDENSIAVTITGESTPRVFTFPAPHPIYLAEYIPDHFTLRVPKLNSASIKQERSRLPSFQELTGFRVATATQSATEQCGAITDNTRAFEGIVDLGTYFKLLQLSPNKALEKMEVARR